MSIDVTEAQMFAFTRPAWITQAACRGMNPDLFFPDRGEDTTQAKAVCAGCSVRAECLEAALMNMDKHGIFGGTSERERRRMRTHVVVIEHGTERGYKQHRHRGGGACDARKAAHAEATRIRRAGARDAAWLATELRLVQS